MFLQKTLLQENTVLSTACGKRKCNKYESKCLNSYFSNGYAAGCTTQTQESSDEAQTQQDQSGTETPSVSNPQTHDVDIKDFAFKLREITIKKGDTVVWTNKDSAGHTVTSEVGDELGSELLAKGETYSHTFNEVGTFDYYCIPHPYMVGTVIVEE